MTRSSSRLALFAGTAIIGLGSGASPASAQATGGHTLANVQTSASPTIAQIDDGSVSTQSGDLESATIIVRDTMIAAKARSNIATASLADADMDVAQAQPTVLATAAGSSTGSGDLIITNKQFMTGTLDASLSGNPLGATAGDTNRSGIAVTGNQESASAIGNQLSAAITRDGTASRGAGIASAQTLSPRAAAGVTARVEPGMAIAMGGVSASQVAMSDNAISGHAAGNAVDNLLDLTGASSNGAAGAASLSTTDDAASSAAALGIVNQQDASGQVKSGVGMDSGNGAPEGPLFAIRVAADADGANLANERNAANAVGDMNRAANAITLDAPGATQSAGIVNKQAANQAKIVASVGGGVEVEAVGTAARSNASARDNELIATATANGSSNVLEANAGAFVRGAGGQPASAAVLADQEVVVTADQDLLNRQDYGSSTVTAVQYGTAARVTIGGDLSDSQIGVTGNRSTAGATGNDAKNSVSLKAAASDATGALINLQSGDGSVAAQLGTLDSPSGGVVVASGAVAGGIVDVSGNQISGSAAGNVASNALGLETASFAGAGTPASAGPIDTAYGATGDLALANAQKLGQPSATGALTPSITSNVTAEYGMTSAAAQATSIELGTNSQRNEALGNEVVNQLTVRAPGNGTSALSSSQFAQALLSSASTMSLAAPGKLEAASVEIRDNSNVALALLNDADNNLAFTGSSSAGNRASVSAGLYGPPSATGDVALANEQFASGAAQSVATIHATQPAGLARSSFAVTDNAVMAESDGNRAANRLATEGAGAALANSQVNTATVGASAAFDLVVDGAVAASLDHSSAKFADNAVSSVARGNVATNQIVLAGDAGRASNAAIEAGGLNGEGDGVLLNAQANLAPVSASASVGNSSWGLAGAVTTSSLTATGNSAMAAASGNAATNIVNLGGAGTPIAAGIINNQSNQGAIAATVSGTNYRLDTTMLRSSGLNITGNQLAATAVGNQASSAIASSR